MSKNNINFQVIVIILVQASDDCTTVRLIGEPEVVYKSFWPHTIRTKLNKLNSGFAFRV